MLSRIACFQSMRSLSRRLLVSTAVFCAASFVFTESVHAQVATTEQDINSTVKGRVSDEDGKPLQGVTVQIKGSSGGVVTNAKGEYQLAVHSKSAVLVFTHVGMQTQEVAVGSKTELNISLQSIATQQQE